MKVLFVGRSVFHFSYYDSLLLGICRKGYQVEALFDERWSQNQPDAALQKFVAAGHANFSWRWAVRRGGILRDYIFGMRELRSYASYLRRPNQSDFYLNRWANYLPSALRGWITRSVVQALLKLPLIDGLFRLLEAAAPAALEVVADIRRSAPDLIVVSPGNMRFDEEIEYVKAGKVLGVPTAIVTLSWDNLTTKGLFHVKPDLLFCWNDAHAREAVEVHGIPASNVLKIGSMFFDKWFAAKSHISDRQAFCHKVGLDPHLPFFLYLGSSSNIANDESWLVEDILSALQSHPSAAINQVQLLVRPHPANSKNYLRLDGRQGLALWPKVGALPESDESQADFVDSVRLAVAAIGINTSGMIDNIILGKPCVAIVTERYKKTQDQAIHFGHLFRSGALEVVGDGSQCVAAMAALLDGDDKKCAAREEFVRAFARPYGLAHAAGDLGAVALEILAKNKKWSRQSQDQFLSALERVKSEFE
ncbi:hypothetical protein [Methylomonas sp. CM2]|uniref:hypothetical protein n=1 Tax=Methylomonas sp. CM2 TaxID=3417647 RepID=UPI003CEA9BEA